MRSVRANLQEYKTEKSHFSQRKKNNNNKIKQIKQKAEMVHR